MPRYIDADKLKNAVMNAMAEKSAKDGAFPMLIGHLLCQFIDATKTADVQEVKHGKWILSKFHLSAAKCSFCGKTGDGVRTFYCSFCGARMDGEKE